MRVVLLGAALLCCTVTYAQKGVPKMGYAQTVEFRDAVASHSHTATEEPLEARQVIEFSPYNRAYTRVRGGRGTLILDHLKNDSDFDFLPMEALPTSDAARKKQRQLSMAWGYLKDNWAMEIELYLPKSITYVSDPALVHDAGFTYPDTENQASFRYSARMRQGTTYANLNYMLFNYNNMQPYLAVGIGVTAKMYRVEETGGATPGVKNYALLHPAWNLGAGIAIQLSKNAGIDISYRHIDLGHSKFHAARKVDHFKLKSTSSRVQGYTLGIFWRY